MEALSDTGFKAGKHGGGGGGREMLRKSGVVLDEGIRNVRGGRGKKRR